METADAPAPVGSGVAVSDDLGVTFHWVTGLDPTAAVAEPGIGRMSFAQPAPSRLYVLGERHRTLPPVADLASVWRLDPTAAAPAAALLTGVPAVWFRLDSGKNQRDYDQAIAVDPVTAATDRLYLAGNFVDRSAGPLQSSQPASVWCLEVPVAGTALVPAPGISRSGPVAAGGDGASPAGLIGDDIHPDVHTIRFAGAAPNRQVWVTTDGGVFLSTRAGRVNSFAPRSTGLAALEANFVAPHPTSSQYVAAGMQDNGRHVRRGDVVWVDTKGGDGGGVVFHPVASQVILSQFTSAGWSTDPAAGFVDPLDQGGGAGEGKREFEQSAFYSGTAAVIRAPSATRVVIGTNRVWLTEDLAVADPCTWKALPFPSGVPTNPRPGGSDPPAKQNVGVPAGGPLPAIAGGVGPLRKVITQKWASPTSLLVVFERGVVRWTFAAGTWTARVLVPGVAGAPDPAKTLLSDVAPVPGTSDFYLVTTGDTAGPPGETCLFFHDASSAFFPTGLRAQLAPLDPAYASVVDPGAPADVYVGTVTGVWRGTRGAGPPAPGADWPHTWGALVNGLPQAAVQDLSVWHDPAGPPRLLRAAMQSRGIWELDLAKPDEPERTYVKVHPHDDRRRLPTPMKDPRRAPAAPDVAGFASPDILVRPRPMVGIDPAWPLAAGATVSGPGGMPPYQLWTFQTAFRWLFPSVTADGEWSAPFGQMVALHRSTVPALGPAVPRIDKPLWDAVVGGLRVSPAGVVPGGGGDPLAVYRAPWATAIVPDAVATELDLHEHVVLPVVGDVAQVFAELSTVDVLIHHRDIRELSPGSAFALLFWQSAPGAAALLGLDTNPVRDYALAVAGGGAVPAAAPAGWRVVLNGAGDPRHTLPVALDARMPRAVPIELNLTGESGNRVLLLAVVGSDVDPCTDLGVGLPAPAPPPPPPPPARPTVTPVDLARRWPYAAVRQLSVSPR
jgi:hypothetical protein